jgi:hypothetical protein
VYDEWITAGTAHFRSPGYLNLLERSSTATNSSVLASTYFGLLRRRKPAKFGAYLYEGSHYFCAEYRNIPLPIRPSWLQLVFIFTRCNALVWTDSDTWRLAKVVLTLKPSRMMTGGRLQEITHLFSCCEEPVSIVPPAFSLLGPAQPKWKEILVRLAQRWTGPR